MGGMSVKHGAKEQEEKRSGYLVGKLFRSFSGDKHRKTIITMVAAGLDPSPLTGRASKTAFDSTSKVHPDSVIVLPRGHRLPYVGIM
jgi:hypothetical protein